MKFVAACFVVISVIYCAKGQSTTVLIHPALNNGSTVPSNVSSTPLASSPISITTQAINTSAVIFSSPSMTHGSSPNNTATKTPNTTHSINSTMSSAFNSNSTTVHHNGSMHITVTATVLPTIQSHFRSKSVGPTQPPTKSSGKDDDYDSMKKRMWIAASFAIIFALTTVILAYLVYRQRKINRELEGDPASSRLL